jgi:hypothetical protein
VRDDNGLALAPLNKSLGSFTFKKSIVNGNTAGNNNTSSSSSSLMAGKFVKASSLVGNN